VKYLLYASANKFDVFAQSNQTTNISENGFEWSLIAQKIKLTEEQKS
jgi:hypothetical protein